MMLQNSSLVTKEVVKIEELKNLSGKPQEEKQPVGKPNNESKNRNDF